MFPVNAVHSSYASTSGLCRMSRMPFVDDSRAGFDACTWKDELVTNTVGRK